MPSKAAKSPLPLLLRRTARWVNYIPGKKIPLSSVSGRAAFTGERSESRSTHARASKRDPANLGFDIDCPFVGVDLDKVVEDGSLTARGRELLDALPATYAEFSPSRRGLHLWYRVGRKTDHAALPNAAVGDHIEIYSRLRWFTVTGLPVNGIRTVSLLTRDEALAVFALGKTATKPSKPRKFGGEPGLWSLEALDSFLDEMEVEYRTYKGDEFRVRCPGTVGWPDGTRHDDDGLERNATCATVRNGWPLFHCHHAKCLGKQWRDFRRFYDPRSGFSLDSWIMDHNRELRGSYR